MSVVEFLLMKEFLQPMELYRIWFTQPNVRETVRVG